MSQSDVKQKIASRELNIDDYADVTVGVTLDNVSALFCRERRTCANLCLVRARNKSMLWVPVMLLKNYGMGSGEEFDCKTATTSSSVLLGNDADATAVGNLKMVLLERQKWAAAEGR